MLDRELIRGWAVALGRHVGVALAGLVWLVALTRSLEPGDVGTVVLAGALPALVVPLLNLGVPMGVAYLTASRPEHVSGIGRWARRAAFRLAAVAGALMCVGAAMIAVLVSSIDPAVLLGLLAVPPALAAAVVSGWFQGSRRFGTQAGILVAPHVLAVVGTMAAIAAGWSDVVVLVSVVAGAHVVTGVWAVWMLSVNCAAPTPDVGREVWSHAWRMWLSEAGAAVRGRLDLVLIAALLGTADAAVFATATAVAAQLALVSLGANQVVFPLVAARRDDQRADVTAAASRMTFAATVVAAGLVGLTARPLLGFLYGDEFADGARTLIAYLPVVVLLSVSRVVTADLYGRGEAGLVLRLSLQATAVALPLLVAGVALWGVEGAAAGASLGAAFNTAIRVRAWRGLAQRSGSLIAFGRSDVAALRAAFPARSGSSTL